LLLAITQRLQTFLKGTLLLAKPDRLKLRLQALLADLFLLFIKPIELRPGRSKLAGPLAAIVLFAAFVDERQHAERTVGNI
jgi:hypothetical protein